jgi:hypothetical protein
LTLAAIAAVAAGVSVPQARTESRLLDLDQGTVRVSSNSASDGPSLGDAAAVWSPREQLLLFNENAETRAHGQADARAGLVTVSSTAVGVRALDPETIPSVHQPDSLASIRH